MNSYGFITILVYIIRFKMSENEVSSPFKSIIRRFPSVMYILIIMMFFFFFCLLEDILLFAARE